MKRPLIIFLMLFLLLESFPSPSTIAEEKTTYNILVLNAYHYGYEWTDNQTIGLSSTLSEEFPNALIYIEYLDWKRFPDEDVIEQSYKLYEEKYKDIPIDLILTTDDMGLSFALNYREALFNNAPIVFSGILEHTATEIIGNQKNVTGVYEKMNPSGALELLKTLQPEVNRIYVVHDQSESGLRTAETFYLALESFDINNKYEVVDLSNLTFNELIDKVKSFEANSAIMMISYNISIDGQVQNPEIFGEQLTAVSSVPVYSIDEFLLGHGIIGGTFLSGVLQGEELAKLGIQILKGTSADSLPHIDKATVYSAVDEDALIKYNLDKSKLSEEVKIINEHISFFEAYKSLVLTTILIITILLLSIIILMINSQIRKKAQQEVLEQKTELQLLYDQLAASEEELKAQNDELQKYQTHLEYSADHDSLTQLPNRRYLEKYTKELLDNETRANLIYAIIYIDIDNFKFINNTYGHAFGDQVLKWVSKRILQLNTEHFVARLGGDEFILIANITTKNIEDHVSNILTMLTNSLNHPIQIDKETITITTSMGYTIYPIDGKTFDELIVQADISMLNAKKGGKSTFRHYSKSMSDKLENDFIILSHLREAYEKKELSLYFQPQIDIQTEQIVGFEALLRWNSKELDYVPPNRFIPIAESSGLIIQIGGCVIELATLFALKMKELLKDPFKVSINISVVQLLENNFAESLIQTIKSFNLDPSYFQIEITESLMIDYNDLVIKRLNEIEKSGISISLDDFGTGFSSLTYLHRLPLNELKIDKFFVDSILTSPKHPALLDTIINLAKNLNLKVVAEGVEEEAQMNYLKKKGCDIIQGYYYSKPLPIEEVIVYCKEKRFANKYLN